MIICFILGVLFLPVAAMVVSIYIIVVRATHIKMDRLVEKFKNK